MSESPGHRSKDARKGSRAEGQGEYPAPTLWQTWLSVLAAFFGVQSSANRERDFKRGKASHFILLGLLATILLVALLAALVRLAIVLAG